ncbi:aldolase catalytic domain-containing protein [Marinobacter sp. 1_MG-2023]|uniref:aldolase catalytic domain-containing protein n=1 Tax=Marinobacter sp. 1_MG-2023 TaxID=3062627 RepID=UPI0026E2F10D|nr:aldolase catalytic domain-containing protein [Marinobacter sp. 1_MG-2023]MDO6825235.1 aldolase catalytic domain-containing protein [Marinobacter sp. 1_MG-2023]
MITQLDCTLRDGGYYNNWNFERGLVENYLGAMVEVGVGAIEIGLRSLRNQGFKGASAFCKDEYLKTLPLPDDVLIGVMVNASELVDDDALEYKLGQLFPVNSAASPVSLVRIACHVHEFSSVLPATEWLRERGYIVGFNLMQVADRTRDEIRSLAQAATQYQPDVLYFADSMGCMDPRQTAEVISWLREGWQGPLGIHTHDNMGLALQNTLCAIDQGVTWVDATVTGMGRGPGNARTEELAIEMAERKGQDVNLIPLMQLIRTHFRPMQYHYGWGTNPYYFLAGKFGIHPSYVQEMLADSRYLEEDILAVIEHLRKEGGKKFSREALDSARHFYRGEPEGSWSPDALLEGREVLLLGSGPGVKEHNGAIEQYIREYRPLVMALNTQSSVDSALIDVRVACHPVRLLADCDVHSRLPQPLITPASMLPDHVRSALRGKELLDYGFSVRGGTFRFGDSFCTVPVSLVIAYALAIATSGKALRILMAGFDGYGADDPRSAEMQSLLSQYQACAEALPLLAVTPTRYSVPVQSIYAM